MANLQEYVADYVAQLAGPNGEDAWHSLLRAYGTRGVFAAGPETLIVSPPVNDNRPLV